MKRYIVKEEDTLHKVAWENNIFVKDILDCNPHLLNSQSYIYPGDEIYLPLIYVGENRVERFGECLKEFSHLDIEHYVYKWNMSRNVIPLETKSIGLSILNKPIRLIKVGDGKKKVFYSGSWHGNEWMTSKLLTEWLDHIITSANNNQDYFGTDLRQLFKEVTLYVVPMVNPDGVALVQQGNYPEHPYYDFINKTNKYTHTFDHWSANIRGVDLNHQWPAGWQKEADESPSEPWPRHYSGKAPLTEPESICIYDLTVKEDFDYVLAFHSQGQEIFWGYRGLEPQESEKMVERLSLKSSYVPKRTADSDGGYKDWFIQETRRPGFTIEVGVGINPLPFRAYGEIWSNNVLLALEGLKL
ncbi:M14 family metallopeptidase [Evansella cellulosilytica]|uniref:Peptidase M14 carboxypeptidase A n=1 Tax=Evansella cellulosilytica (strain ATCC 21833 / DSM 2522 / FERM P-1141 / JCM 9156 / N-4) TaxID=649639 RepID=E6TYP0_EVAC2|nr:M14 family metallopeptidase [Evansella cellulosilytica]ADU30090.1 peptidase M14 carboxypeptidase A [Evansella cellulosilytica DSM 2522]